MKNHNKNNGFTIVEIAIVMVIFGLLMSMFGSVLASYQLRQKYEVTHQRMAVIQDAIDEYLELNGRLPCVARMDRDPDAAGFGVEAFSTGPSGERTCRFGIAGTRVFQQTAPAVGGPVPHWNRWGSVPVRSLNIPDEYMLDGWGTRFTYIVSERQASEVTPGVSMYAENAGALNIVDTNGNPVIDQKNPQFPGFSNFAEYVLISHGEDQAGGIALWNDGGDPPTPIVPCPGIAVEQAENCTHTGARSNIVVSEVKSDAQNNNDYDDIVIFKAGTNFGEILPSGAVIGYDQYFAEDSLPGTTGGDMAFEIGDAGRGPGSVSTAAFTCPPGWALLQAAEGRFIMGATAPGDTVERRRRSSSVTVTTGVNRNYNNIGRSGGTGVGDARVSVPPYVTTLFCEKQ